MIFGGRRILRKTKNLFQVVGKKYQNEQFWKEFGKQYYDKYKNKKSWVIKQEELLLAELKKLEFNSVLEFGCGFGRLTKLLTDNFEIKNYTAFDISEKQIENAKKYCGDIGIQFQVSSIKDFSTDKKFDLVVGPEILLHIEPKNIEFVIKKMSGFATKYFIQTGSPYSPDQKIHRATHTFYHDYKTIYQKIGLPKPFIIPVNEINEIHIITLGQ